MMMKPKKSLFRQKQKHNSCQDRSPCHSPCMLCRLRQQIKKHRGQQHSRRKRNNQQRLCMCKRLFPAHQRQRSQKTGHTPYKRPENYQPQQTHLLSILSPSKSAPPSPLSVPPPIPDVLFRKRAGQTPNTTSGNLRPLASPTIISLPTPIPHLLPKSSPTRSQPKYPPLLLPAPSAYFLSAVLFSPPSFSPKLPR